ncbi:MAG: insulinase family protein [Alphaproteobacteria bacterium]|nr:insulinase family protein [Alphaproteobacteria bacterium]
MKTFWTAAAAVALAAGALSEADAQTRQRATQTAMPDIDIPFETFTLDNGLRVVVSTDRKAPVVAVGVWYGVGSRDEEEGRTGFAHLFEHLMFNGSENYNQDYFGPFEEVGATDMNGTTWFDRTNYFQTVPTPALELALFMESDRMGHLLGVVDQARLDEQRGVVQNEKRQGDNQPYGLVEYSMLEGLFPAGHPYSWSTIGSMEDLSAASLADVQSWFRQYYGAANAVVAVVGDVDAATVRPMMERYFGDIDPGPPLARREAAVPIRAANTRDLLRDRVPQPRIYRTWATPGRTTRDALLLELAADVLGQGKSSRLYEALVYEQRIATDVSANLEEHELASMFNVELTLAPGVDVEEGARRLDAEIARYLQQGPTAGELQRVAMRRYAAFVRQTERVGGFTGKASVLAEGWLYAGDAGFYRRQLQWMREARPADVAGVAREWLQHGYHQVDVTPFGALAASGGGADRSALPAVASTPDLTFPALEEGRLSSGARVVVARREGAPVVEIAAMFEGGFTADAGRKQGLSSFTTAMLDEGTTTRSALEISEEAERLGAQLFAGAALETNQVRLSALRATLTPSLALMADVIRNPSFADTEIERVRGIWLAQIQQEQAQPTGLALRLLPPAIYGADSPYGAPLTGTGTPESIASLTRDDMIAFHRERLRPDNTTFFVVGDLSLGDATAALESAFGGWSAASAAAPAQPSVAAPARTSPRLIIVDRPNAPQSFILAGRATTPSAAPNALAQDVMNDSFGGLFSARLNMNLREAKGWSYGAYSFFREGRGPRPWLIYAPVQTDRTVESVAEVRRELADVASGRPISAEEFERARTQALRSLPGSFESTSNVLGALTGAQSIGRPLDWTATLTERLRALTLEEARAASVQIIDADDLVWIIVGDRAQIEAGLRGLNIAPVEIWDESGRPVQ